jgi:DNA invertase Pin-like site-specific DNA recombinase
VAISKETAIKGDCLVYAYIRVSTDKQTVENQRFEINRYCNSNNLKVFKWIEECISGKKDIQERELGKLIKKMKKDDVLICSELSRLGRNLLMIMGILNECMARKIKVWAIKENYRLGNDIGCKVLAFAFGLSAEIERNLISDRTKEALARRKAEGIKLGRPLGSKSKKRKLQGKEPEIQEMLENDVSQIKIAKNLKVNRKTVAKVLEENDTKTFS